MRGLAWRLPVHPHVRGVYAEVCLRAIDIARSIPTCVGFTIISNLNQLIQNGPSPRAWGLRYASHQLGKFHTVHPHVRGVYEFYERFGLEAPGPSPRAWGLLHCDPGSREKIRSIPTCVGFTKLISNKRQTARSIPTCVGFTRARMTWMSQDSVHPHVRGVYAGAVDVADTAPGPSPRAWGLRTPLGDTGAMSRSIPTCVGFTNEAEQKQL